MKRRYVFGIVLLLVLFLVLCVAAVAEADGAATEFSAGTEFTVEDRTIRTTKINSDLTIKFGDGTEQTVSADIPLNNMYCILKDDVVLVQELDKNWYNGTGTGTVLNNCNVTAGTLNPESRVVLLETDGKMHAFSAGTGTGNDKLVIGETLDLRDCIKTAHLGIGVDEEWRIDLTSEIRIDIRGMGYVSFTGSYLKTRIKGDFSFPKTKIEDYTCEFHSDKISVCLTEDSLPLSREFTIVKIRKGLAFGLYLDFSPTLSIEKTGKGQVDFTFTGREGFYTDLYIVPSIPPVFYPTGADWKHTKPTFQVTSVDVEGEFYVGPSWGGSLAGGRIFRSDRP